MEDLVGFIVAGFALTGSPGPATLGIAASGAAFGRRRSIGFVAGIIVGVTTVMAITASGLIGLVLAVPGAAPAVTAMAAAYMVYLAWRIATAPPLSEDNGGASAPSFLAGLVLNLANPKAYAAMTALFSGFVLIVGQPVPDALTKGAVLLIIICTVNTTWLHIGAGLTRMFHQPRQNRIINVSFAILLLASVALALWL